MRDHPDTAVTRTTAIRPHGHPREGRAVRRARSATRLAQPILRYLMARFGRAWEMLLPALDRRLRRLRADRFLRQRVRHLVLRALGG